VDRIVADGTNRIGDLEFRLVELEGGDVSRLGETRRWAGARCRGGGALRTAAHAGRAGRGAGPAAGHGRAGGFRPRPRPRSTAASTTWPRRTSPVHRAYPGSPLTGEAHFWRGEALSALGDASGAARAYLESFSGDPQGMMAADALLQLGLALDRLGQRQESCVMLGEVTARFPSSAASIEAQAARGSMNCV
jgi:tol-pal system protein YbgF